MDRTQNQIRNISSDRVVKLQTKPGENTLDNKGLVDNRLFTGKNNLHLKMDKQTSLWYPQYESGITPQPLQQRFTSYSKALDYITQYYAKRNVEVKEVVDA